MSPRNSPVGCIAAALATACLAGSPGWGTETRDPTGAVVIALHGLARTGVSMRILADRIEAGGYRVAVIDYPSTDATFDELLASLHTEIARCCQQAHRVHFVTYSLGGILTRAYLAETPLPRLGRVVMLAPPNRGSEWVDRLRGLKAFRQHFGPVGSDLGTGPDSLPQRLGPPNFEFGVIAGTKVLNPLGWLMIPGDSDGTVSVERTKLEGMSDFLEVPHSHTFIMNSPEVADATLRFLKTGRFREAGEAAGGRP